jgi:ADP-ribose pyrophosphatase YjhB (NUDIX family)
MFIIGKVKRGGLKMEQSSHNLASGIVVVKAGAVLLVRDKNGWSLPKGSTEIGETFLETAIREGREETGLNIEVTEVAFVTEYKTKEYGQYLQVYYAGNYKSDSIRVNDPDEDIREVRFIPFNELKNYLKFRPWIVPLEDWIAERIMKYYYFNLDEEGFEV